MQYNRSRKNKRRMRYIVDKRTKKSKAKRVSGGDRVLLF